MGTVRLTRPDEWRSGRPRGRGVASPPLRIASTTAVGASRGPPPVSGSWSGPPVHARLSDRGIPRTGPGFPEGFYGLGFQ
ncbi:protein of unknown function [Blastococcus saxobsidens DD2]|uniref:Uncharacterized protein n=1 Tax=Blastococcus saxobsidens (strain DD2) TaxID=1146883 RepID=H6RT00_BLASD|nr:protein of unknown function [Blastococcus saxobsidens DD2]